MKLLISALALACAFTTPAFAQNAPSDPHARHAQPARPAAPAPQACTAEHAAMGHCKPAQGGPAALGQAVASGAHDADCCKKDANGKMACCEKARTAGKNCCAEDGAPPTQSGHTGH